MRRRIRKALLWLMMTLMVLFGTVGCGRSEITVEQKDAVLQLAGDIAEVLLEAAEETADIESTQRQTDDENPAKTELEFESEETEAVDIGTEAAGDIENIDTETEAPTEMAHTDELGKHGSYTSKADVAAYIHTYGCLPENFITKNEAEDLGWNSKEGNLWDVAPGMSIGGSKFGNYEKLLPEKKGRKYYECDIDYDGGYRGAKRIIYSNDGLIFYTEDHYETFEQLY